MINQEKMIDHKSLMNKLEVMINQKEAIKGHFNSNMHITRKMRVLFRVGVNYTRIHACINGKGI
jgi:hypothetical protein